MFLLNCCFVGNVRKNGLREQHVCGTCGMQTNNLPVCGGFSAGI